MLKPALGVLN